MKTNALEINKNNKGERTMKTSKRFMAALTAMIMVILSLFTCGASAANTNTAGTGYIPDYSGNGSNYNGNYYYQYNNSNNVGYYGYWQGNNYYDYYGNQINVNSSYSADAWFNNNYGNRFRFTWIKSPQAPAIRGDYFRAVYDTEMSYAQRGNSYNNYGGSYGYNSYNSYPMGNPQRFADFWNYQKYNRMISILNGTSGGYGANILDGREVNGQLYLDFDSCILRGEAAKLCIRTNECWWGLSAIRNMNYFADTYDHWAMDEIAAAYSVGLVNGVGGNIFNPNATLTNQEMLVVFCNLVDRSSKYTIDQFIDMVNASDVARITEVYWDNNNNGNNGNNGNNNVPSAWRFSTHTVPLNVGDTFELKSIISSWNDTIRFSSDDTSVATVNGNGHITAEGVGKATITATDSYGNTDTVNVVVSQPGSDRPVITPAPDFKFTQDSITVQKGERVDLSTYVENVSGNVTYASNDSNIVSMSGSMALAVNVGYANVTAMCGNQTDVISIQVVDNNAKQDLNVSVQYGAFNESGTLNVMVRGIPAGYSVKINDGDYMLQHVNEQETGLETMRKFQITGLYPTTGIDAEGQPEGGYDSVIVCVYDQNGVQVWEDPQGLYCPQFNAYMSTLGWY